MDVVSKFPTGDDWPDLDEREHDRRAKVLWDITLRVMADGPHKARPAAVRGRLFAPFDALEGYDELLAEAERRADEVE